MHNLKTLNIACINIEHNRHLDRVIAFAQQKQPEVMLLQEVLEKDIPYLETALEMKSTFAALNYLGSDSGIHKLGLATFSTLPILQTDNRYYRGDGANLPYITHGQPEKMARAILITEIAKAEQKYCLVNTHFTWSANATPTADQHMDLDILLPMLTEIKEFVLAGDFNTPRGKVIFDTLAAKYRDNIPAHISSTLDKNLHVAKHLNIVVDGLFTTPKYQARDVEVVSDVSDHCAITANISVPAVAM